MEPDPPPCELPAWPGEPPDLAPDLEVVAGKQTGRAFLTPKGIGNVASYVAAVTAYYDANERCRKAARR